MKWLFAVIVASGCVSLLTVGCTPIPDPSVGLSPDAVVDLINRATPAASRPTDIAEAFALGTRATDVQREMLQSDLVGRAVDWTVPVYEVAYSNGRYQVTSQPIAITDPEAVPLIRVMAIVIPQSDTDDARLRAVHTDDVVRFHGIVQEIRLRTVIVIAPAVLILTDEPNFEERP